MITIYRVCLRTAQFHFRRQLVHIETMKVIILISVVLAVATAFPNNVFEFEQGKPVKKAGSHWALLVAGSNGYFNYRHQADVCHAYQILRRNGFDEDRIITMMYDDIAYNTENPVQGNIINKPDGPNVYEGVKIDYKGKDVNPDKFIAVLTGDAEKAGGKVIESGPDDFVFVNFVDHGAPGILGFGTKTLKASKLNQAIMDMHKDGRYAKMVFYVEACESGSVFDDLLSKDISVFATTAANPHESSYACYFDKSRRTYLGDVYSVKWMEDSDKEDLSSETLEKQFKITKEETNTSHVQQYGDMSIASMVVAEFQGNEAAKRVDSVTLHDACSDAVKSEDVPLEILRRSLELETTEEGKQKIRERKEKLEKERELVTKTMKILVGNAAESHGISSDVLEKRKAIKRWDCYEDAVDYLIENCQDHLNLPKNDFALRHLYMIVNLCEANIPVETIKSAAEKACQ